MLVLSGCQIPFTDKQVTVPFLEKKPEDALGLMMEKMNEQVNDYSYEAEMSIGSEMDDIKYEVTPSSEGSGLGSMGPVKTGKTRTISIKEDMSGQVQRNKNGSLNMKQDIELEFDFDETMTFRAGLGLKMVEGSTFFRIKKVPQMLEMFIPPKFKDSWIMATSSASDQEMLSGLNIGASINFSLGNEEEKKERKEKVEEFAREAEKILKGNSIIEPVKRLADEKVDGHNCYHYQVKLKRETVDELKDIFLQYIEEEVFTGEEVYIGEDIDKFKTFINSWQEILKSDSGEVWVDKKDFYLRKYKADMKFDLTKLNELFEKKEDEAGVDLSFDTFNLDFSVSGRFFDFDQGVNIEKPEDYSSISEILNESLAPMRMETNDSLRVGDIKRVQTALELYFNDEKRYPKSISFDGSSSLVGSSSEKVYMAIIPSNPEYYSNEVCPKGFQYEYRVKENGLSYEIDHCLEIGSGGISAGMHKATPAGIDDGQSPPSFELRNDDLEGSDIEHVDSDNDGLDDMSEAIFGTDPNDPDTDGDGYLDGNEVNNGYNPAGEGDLDAFYMEQMGSSTEVFSL